nr:hypothetical protein PanWU01x14_244740 [Ipomoea batatas]
MASWSSLIPRRTPRAGLVSSLLCCHSLHRGQSLALSCPAIPDRRFPLSREALLALPASCIMNLTMYSSGFVVLKKDGRSLRRMPFMPFTQSNSVSRYPFVRRVALVEELSIMHVTQQPTGARSPEQDFRDAQLLGRGDGGASRLAERGNILGGIRLRQGKPVGNGLETERRQAPERFRPPGSLQAAAVKFCVDKGDVEASVVENLG